jgi:hypothetical protein
MNSKSRKTAVTIKTGNIHDISGSVNIAGGDIKHQDTTILHYNENTEVIIKALTEALKRTRKRPKTSRAHKTGIEKEIRQIESEVGKKKFDRGFLTERFRNIAKMAPDILEVIIAGLGSPATALALTMRKIAEKAKAGTEGEVVSK